MNLILDPTAAKVKPAPRIFPSPFMGGGRGEGELLRAFHPPGSDTFNTAITRDSDGLIIIYPTFQRGRQGGARGRQGDAY